MRSKRSPRLPDWSLRRWWLTAVGALALSACGVSGAPVLSKVVVDQLQTDIVFGATQPSPAAAPVALPAAPGLGLSQPFVNDFGFGNFTVPAAGGLCPSAPPTAFPAQEATSDVTAKPTPGEYTWAGKGSYYYTPLPTITLQIPISPSFTEVVRRVAPANPTVAALPGSPPSLNFTYETVEPQFGNVKGGYWDFHWKVESSGTSGDPNAGLSLMEVDTLDSNGNQTGTVFQGQPGLLLLPLPAAPGPVGVQTASGNQGPTVSADTSPSGNNMQFSGTVGPRERVDACGTWLQAWPVDGTLMNGANSAKIHMDVATQFGAIVIALNFVGDKQVFLGTTFNNLLTHTGQTAPSPLEKKWQ